MTKGKRQKNRQFNDQRKKDKKTNNGRKTKERAIRTPLIPGVN
jgi:hypothetical protein